jgi:hypothetical protein
MFSSSRQITDHNSRLDDRSLIPVMRRYLRYRVQTDYVAHPASYPVGTEGSFPEVKRQGRETNQWLPFGA